MKKIFKKIKKVIDKVLSLISECFIIYFFREKMLRSYMFSHKVRCLHLGCGARNFSDWLNVDLFQSFKAYLFSDPKIIPMDLRKKLPLPSDSFDFIYSEHVHEHLSYEDGLNLLRECNRVLKPGGVLRISVPNLDLFINLIVNPLEISDDDKVFFNKACEVMGVDDRKEPKIGVSLLNKVIGDKGYKYNYNFSALSQQLKDAGFSLIIKENPGKSEYKELNNLESNYYNRYTDELLLKFSLWHTASVEAIK